MVMSGWVFLNCSMAASWNGFERVEPLPLRVTTEAPYATAAVANPRTMTARPPTRCEDFFIVDLLDAVTELLQFDGLRIWWRTSAPETMKMTSSARFLTWSPILSR